MDKKNKTSEKHELQEIIAVVNNKGGVGKTTTVQNLAAGLLRRDKHLRVLVIDLDPQCNLSSLLRLSPNSCTTVYDAMCKQSGLTIYKAYNGVYAVCGSAQMQNIEQHLPNGSSLREIKKGYYVLLKCIQSECIDETGEGLRNLLEDFDYILIDCPPALSKSTYNAVVAASSVLVPVQMESLSVRGLKEILEVMDEVKEDGLNADIQLSGLLPVMIDGRTRFSKEMSEFLHDRFADKILKHGVRRCIKVNEAQGQNESIFDYAPYCSAGIDYEEAVKEIFGV